MTRPVNPSAPLQRQCVTTGKLAFHQCLDGKSKGGSAETDLIAWGFLLQKANIGRIKENEYYTLGK